MEILSDVLFYGACLSPIVIIILIVIFVVKVIRRMEHRADEKLKLEKENIDLQQKQMQEINSRLENIEKKLKEVD